MKYRKNSASMRPSFFQEDRRDFVNRLGLLKTLFDIGLPLVSFQDLFGRQGSVVGQQRIHAVGLLIIIHAVLIDPPSQPQASLGLTTIARVFVGPPFAILAKTMALLRPDLDLQIVHHA